MDEIDHKEHVEPWLYIVAALALTIVVSFLLDSIAGGVLLGFNIPLLNEPATISAIIYHATAIVIGGYVGILGLKELILERKFSVEVLMASAA